mgnify:CR=1 FL=1
MGYFWGQKWVILTISAAKTVLLPQTQLFLQAYNHVKLKKMGRIGLKMNPGVLFFYAYFF